MALNLQPTALRSGLRRQPAVHGLFATWPCPSKSVVLPDATWVWRSPPAAVPNGAGMPATSWRREGHSKQDGGARRTVIGGSRRPFIMGQDEGAAAPALAGEARRGRPQDLSNDLVVQSGHALKPASRDLVRAQMLRLGADRRPEAGALLTRLTAGWLRHLRCWSTNRRGVRIKIHQGRWAFSAEMAAEKHMAQLQHNMWVAPTPAQPCCRSSPGGGKWIEMTINADPRGTSASAADRRKESTCATCRAASRRGCRFKRHGRG